VDVRAEKAANIRELKEALADFEYPSVQKLTDRVITHQISTTSSQKPAANLAILVMEKSA